jgi:hypothetical protein
VCARALERRKYIKDATNVVSNPSLDNINLFPQHVEWGSCSPARRARVTALTR